LPNHKVVITGLGAVTPLGLSAEDYWQGLISGKNGVGLITRFDASSYPVKVAAEVKGFDPTQYMTDKRADRTSLCSQFAIAAARMAVASARLDMSRERAERVGVVLATSGGIHLLAGEQGEILRRRGPMRIDPLLLNKIAPSMVPTQVGLEIGARGPNTSCNSACSSGNDALGNALNHIRLGHADVIFAGGAETQVTPVAIACCGIVGALSRNSDPQQACRPFDRNRSGMVFGDGAGIMVLESYEHARERGAPILAELAGAGWSFDAYNETAPDAEQQALAMKAALDDADTPPEAVDYVNAHGTSTRLNDVTETRAIKLVFGERAYRIPVSSNKSMIGHIACGAAAVEAVAAVMTIMNGIIPPTINYQTPDPDCDLDYVPNTARRQAVSVCLSNSFGMGGQNCCLIIKRPGKETGK
jgi:3-oxoacyl-[acyl-carrier-protein] synthase II